MKLFITVVINLLFMMAIQISIYYTEYDTLINNNVYVVKISNTKSDDECEIINSKRQLYQRYSCAGNTNDITDVNTFIYIFDIMIRYKHSVYYGQACASYLANTLAHNKWDCHHYPYERTYITNGIPMWLCNQCIDQTCNEYNIYNLNYSSQGVSNTNNEQMDQTSSQEKISRCYFTENSTHINTFINNNGIYNFHDVFFNFLPTNMWRTFCILIILPNLLMCIFQIILSYKIIKKELQNSEYTVCNVIPYTQYQNNILNILSIVFIFIFVMRYCSFDIFTNKNNTIMILSFYFCLATVISYFTIIITLIHYSNNYNYVLSLIPIIGIYYFYKQNNEDRYQMYKIQKKIIILLFIIHYIPHIILVIAYIIKYTYTDDLIFITATIIIIITSACSIIGDFVYSKYVD
jgi:hypothetical protein